MIENLIKLCILSLGEAGLLKPNHLNHPGFRDSFERSIELFPKHKGLPMYLWNHKMFAHNATRHSKQLLIDCPHTKVLRWSIEENFTLDHAFSIWAVYMELPYFRHYSKITLDFEKNILPACGLSVICHSWVSRQTGNNVVVFTNHHILHKPYRYKTGLASGPRQLLLGSKLFLEHLCDQDILERDDMILTSFGV